MANRVFVSAVIVLWLGSMSWLMVDKVLPSLSEGEPPIAAGFEPNKPVAWSVSWSGRPVGYAASVRLPGLGQTTNLENRVVLDDVPLMELVPALMRHVVGDIGRMSLDASTRLEFDSLDNFSAFESRVSINDIESLLHLTGRMNGSFLDLKVHFNGVTYSPHVFIPNEAALSETLFPDAQLPNLYVGRQWQEELYSPFRSPNDPVESVEAEVTGSETIEHDEQNQRVMRVEFRGSGGPGVPEEARLQAVAWVRAEDGLVLRQDAYIGASKLRFERLAEEAAAAKGRQLLRGMHQTRGTGMQRPWDKAPRSATEPESRGRDDGPVSD
ncbi:MAG TPA: hypothetical protein VEQ85_01800 [Lacipirellulaceae bacterium]|nr:hypothetical protein [Lacipirellulaceae bacterium]